MRRQPTTRHRRLGRPKKFGRPSEFVPLTLPTDVVHGLRQINADIATAIVRLFETAAARGQVPALDVELVSIYDQRFLIVVNSSVIHDLPGVDIIQLEGERAFLALSPGYGVSDLELAVIDRLTDAGDVLGTRERQALEQLRRQLRSWREDQDLRFHGGSIIVVETPAQRARDAAQPVVIQPDVELLPFAGRRCLIVVNSTMIQRLHGVELIPLSRARAFLALEPGRTVNDLDPAIVERLAEVSGPREQQALEELRRCLRSWLQDSTLKFQSRAIIVVESVPAKRPKRKSYPVSQSARGQSSRRRARATRPRRRLS
jgi:hypothetical protein